MTLSAPPLLRRRVARFAVVPAAAFSVIAAAELAVRMFPDAAPQTELDIYRKDREGNLLLRPGMERRHHNRHWDLTIMIDERGFRTGARSVSDHRGQAATAKTAPAALDPAVPVLVLGDSFAFGWGVEFDKAFPSLVEQQLKQTVSARIINAAVPGTGPSDQLRLLKKLWPVERPAVVVVALFVGNDFTDVGMGGAEQFLIEDGFLFRNALGNASSGPAETLGRALLRRSRLLQALAPLRQRWFGSMGDSALPREWDEWLREFALVHLAEPPERTRLAIKQTLGVLDEMADYCGPRSARLLLLIVPRSYQVYERESAAMRKALAVSPEQVDLDKPQRVLREWAARAGVDAVDLLPSFRRRAAEAPESRLFYFPDAHLTAEGHSLAAEALHPVLRAAVAEPF